MGFKLKKKRPRKAAKKVQEDSKPYSEFEQYEDFDLDDCFKEQNRILRAVDQLERDKKVWTSANKSAQDDLKKKLKHLTHKVEYLEADTEVEFRVFVAERLKEKDANAKKRLKIKKNGGK